MKINVIYSEKGLQNSSDKIFHLIKPHRKQKNSIAFDFWMSQS